jgi:hypothetical protein
MPGKHDDYCPCDFRYIPDANGYTCEGGQHRLSKAGEDESESERARRQKIMDDQDKQRAADIKRQRENQKGREVEACRRGDREREKERERQKERKARTPPPEEPVDELDANPMAMPWLGTPGPAEKVREPELVHARKPKP